MLQQTSVIFLSSSWKESVNTRMVDVTLESMYGVELIIPLGSYLKKWYMSRFVVVQ